MPIFANEEVLDEAGVLFEQDEDAGREEQIEQFREFLDQVRPEDFAGERLLSRAARRPRDVDLGVSRQ